MWVTTPIIVSTSQDKCLDTNVRCTVQWCKRLSYRRKVTSPPQQKYSQHHHPHTHTSSTPRLAYQPSGILWVVLGIPHSTLYLLVTQAVVAQVTKLLLQGFSRDVYEGGKTTLEEDGWFANSFPGTRAFMEQSHELKESWVAGLTGLSTPTPTRALGFVAVLETGVCKSHLKSAYYCD